MIGDGCGPGAARVFSTSTAARFVQVPGLPGGNISPLPGMDTERFGSATSTKAFSIRRQRVSFSAFLGRRFGHKQGAVALLPDRLHGGLWLGFLDGGMAYLKDGQILLTMSPTGWAMASVNDLQLGSDGAVWAATDSGLSRVENGRVMTLTSKNGLPCDAVHWVIEDDDRSLWLYMACGLVRIARSELDAWVIGSEAARSRPRFSTAPMGSGVVTRPGHYGQIVTKSRMGKSGSQPRMASAPSIRGHLPFNKLPPPVDIERDHSRRQDLRCRGGTALASAGARSLDRLHGAEPGCCRKKFTSGSSWRDRTSTGRRSSTIASVQYSNLAPGQVTASASSRATTAGCGMKQARFWIFLSRRRTTRRTGSAGFAWWRFWRCSGVFMSSGCVNWPGSSTLRLEARVSERTRIARELHDTLLQSFHGLLLRFQTVSNLPARPVEAKKRLDSAIDQAAEAITEGRDAVQGLRSSTVETNDLAVAIRTIGEELAADATNQNSVEFRVQVEGTPREPPSDPPGRSLPDRGRGAAQCVPARTGAADRSGNPL